MSPYILYIIHIGCLSTIRCYFKTEKGQTVVQKQEVSLATVQMTCTVKNIPIDEDVEFNTKDMVFDVIPVGRLHGAYFRNAQCISRDSQSSIDSYAVLPWDFLKLSDTISGSYASHNFGRKLLMR